MRYFLYLSYNGAAYSGWQTQPNAPTVQQTIEEALTRVLRLPACPILGAGRTDAGVHARLMVAHLDLALPPWEAERLIERVNRLLPRDIALHHICPMRPEAHARFSARERTYRYYVCLNKDPFAGDQMLRLYHRLDIEKMNEAAALLPHFTDFTSFSKLHTDVKTNNCRIHEARWAVDPARPSAYVFTITADRFLRNMVRAIVGTLFQVGKGQMSLEEFVRIIEAKDRCSAGSSAPGHALFLENVTYPEELFLSEDEALTLWEAEASAARLTTATPQD